MTEEIKALRQEVDEIKKASKEAIAKLEAESTKLIQSQKELRKSFDALEKEILKNHIHQ